MKKILEFANTYRTLWTCIVCFIAANFTLFCFAIGFAIGGGLGLLFSINMGAIAVVAVVQHWKYHEGNRYFYDYARRI